MPLLESTGSLLGFWALIGYLLGSIPFGLVVARVMGLGNLRQIGSGNIGATNVLRTGNKAAAALTLLFDAGKGALALLAARYISGAEDAAQLAGFAAMIGHCFPIWLKFKGGKGVATFLGLMLAYAWPVGIACCLTWLVGAAIWRMSSVAALVSAGSCTFFMFFLGAAPGLLLGVLLTLLIFVRHRENMKRINMGTEPRIGKSQG